MGGRKIMIKLSRILRLSIYLITFALVLSLVGCSSGFKTIVPMLPEKYEKLGHASGEGTGALGILATGYYFIPLGINSRVEDAYDNALKSVPNATALTDVTYQESWFWFLLATGRTVTITGEAIKEVR
jgi:hypothetical protein